MAYGMPSDMLDAPTIHTQKPQPPQQYQAAAPREEHAPPPPSPAAMQEPTQKYNPPSAMYTQQTNTKPPAYYPPQDSFWDRLALKRIEVLKLVVLSLVLVLGLTIYNVGQHYLDSYISTAFMSWVSELTVRLSYPVLVVLIIWIMKSL